MRTSLLILSFFLSLLSFAQLGPVPDVLHYQFSIRLNDVNDSVVCSALVQLSTLHGDIFLDLTGVKSNGKGMKVDGVWNGEDGTKLKFSHANDQLRISDPHAAGATTTLKIDYRGIPADGLIISKNKFNQRTFFSDNWPNRGHNWLVCHDHPSDKASVDFLVTAPVAYQVVSNGIQQEETNLDDKTTLTHWREDRNLPVKVMGIGVAEFAVGYAGAAAGVPVYSWIFPQDKDKGFGDYAIAVKVLPFFIDHISPYPFSKLANIQSKTIFGGMENASAIFYAENSVTGKHKTDKLIAHEIAHQWFGNMATESDWPHLWLSEGFATYLSLLYIESAYGSDSLTIELKKNRRRVIDFYETRQTPIVDTTTHNYMDLLNPNSYEKAGWVLHMLHRQLGDSVFWKGIRTYYSTYAGKNAATDDFRKIMEQVSGKDLSLFFKQWLYGSGFPVLHVTRTYTNKTVTINITQQQASLFRFPLTITIRGLNGDFTKAMMIDKKTTSFTAPMESAPTDVVLDPQTSLLFEER